MGTDPEYPDSSVEIDIRHRRLPHWRAPSAFYFVTFRLADSMPASRREEWRRESVRDREKWLDQGIGSCVLADPRCRAAVESAIRYFDGVRYEVDEFVIASNHVHALVRPRDGFSLSSILKSWKGYSSKQIRGIIGSTVPALKERIWQDESFDHIVRGPESLEKFREYIRSHQR